MPCTLDSPTDTHLDVLRTLGVTDAALRRHHDAGPEAPLRVAIDGDRGSPTADLLAALVATDRVLDLRDGLDAEAGSRLRGALARFGYHLECAEVAVDDADDYADDATASCDVADADGPDGAGDADGADDASSADDAAFELRLTDAVTGATERRETAGDRASVEAVLCEWFADDAPIAFRDLLDGRTLVAERRELESLAVRYGPRIEPFDEPLLAPEDAVDEGSDAPTDGDDSTAGDRSTAADDSIGAVVADTDETAGSIEAALASDGPTTHTVEDDERVADAAAATIGGGPQRTVSTTGIDEVFDQLESTTGDAATGNDGAVDTDAATGIDDATTRDAPATTADAPATTHATATPHTMSDAADSSTDRDESTITDEATHTPNDLTGGPTRTVSTTSADDILDRATGGSDFDAIAAEEDGADPDAVLADAADVPAAIADDVGEVGEAAPTAEEAGANGDQAPSDDPVDGEGASGESVGGATPPSVDPSAPKPASGTDDPDDIGPATRCLPGATVGDPAQASVDDGSTRAQTDDTSTAPVPDDDPGLGDELVGEDVELRRGTEPVDRVGDPAPDLVATEADDESTDADGPLAAAGDVGPASSSPDGGDAGAAGDDAGLPPRQHAREDAHNDGRDGVDGGLLARLASLFGR